MFIVCIAHPFLSHKMFLHKLSFYHVVTSIIYRRKREKFLFCQFLVLLNNHQVFFKQFHENVWNGQMRRIVFWCVKTFGKLHLWHCYSTNASLSFKHTVINMVLWDINQRLQNLIGIGKYLEKYLNHSILSLEY